MKIDTCHKCGAVTEVKKIIRRNELTKKETKTLECSYCNPDHYKQEHRTWKT